MLNQFGQKKKKEAVRRLSQNAARRQLLEKRNLKRSNIQDTDGRNLVFGKAKRRSSEMESGASETSSFVTQKLFTSEESGMSIGATKGAADSLSSFPKFVSSSEKSTALLTSSSEGFRFPVTVTSAPPFGTTVSGLPISSTGQATLPIFGSETTASSGFPVASNVSKASTGFPVSASVNQSASMPIFGLPSTANTGFPVPSSANQTTSIPIFGLPSTANTGFPVPPTVNQTNAGFPVPSIVSQTSIGFPVPSTVSQTNIGFPVPSTVSQTSAGFPVPSTVSQTSAGFPVPSTVSQTSAGFLVPSTVSQTSAGFPVPSPPTFGVLFSSDKNTENKPIGFPVTPVDPKSQSLARFGSTGSITGFGFKKDPENIENRDQSNAFSSVGFPITPVSSASRTLNVFSDSGNAFGFAKDSKEHTTAPVKQSQPFGTTSNVFGKTFADGTKQPVRTLPEERATVTNVSTLKSLVIREIPEEYNKNAWLRRFFSRFGEVVKVVCNPAKASATVVFKTHDAAKLAKVKGRFLRKGLKPVSIFWRQERKRTISSPQDVQEMARENLKEPTVKESIREKTTVKEPVSSLDLQSLPLAMTTGERFKVLEMIDSKLREGLTKASDITTAKAVKGICPDMCPEKERYMREDRRRLHVFEAVPGTGSLEENPLVDHTKAVKEYDRSAADKEEPLPHELRPTATLNMTMDYLVTNIMDIGEGRWADWFDFLWNRTRAIRKDITQQHVCNLESVDLLEKIARFHIFCSHYLCDQDFGVFDPRINTENLTKCLQTLKHSYDDLLKKQNTTCPCEAEFRAYDILLNLNEGDVLRQVMTYREEIRASPLVKFAMNVFHALNSNNFVRFFRLVRSSNYLCACLLHRYFMQVHQQAIRILNYSLSVANKEMTYALNDLTDMLAFEDEDEAAMFCRFHGLTVHEPFVVFSRGSFVQPETAFPPCRSLKLIESKRTCLIGEVVYNGPLPPQPNRKPTSSFDESGQYIGCNHIMPSSPDDKVIKTSSVVRFKGFEHETQTQGGFGRQPLETTKPSRQINIEQLKEATKSLFHEVINEMSLEIANQMCDKVRQLLRVSDDIAKEIEKQSVSEILQEIAENVILHEQRQRLMQAQQAVLRKRVSSRLVSDIVDDVVEKESDNIASHTYSAECKKVIQKSKETASEQIGEELLEETVREETRRLVLTSYREMKAQRKSVLRQIAQIFLKNCTRRYFERWIKSYHSLVRLKKLLSDFPAHPPLTNAEVQLSQLVGPLYDIETSSLHTIRIFEDEQNVAETLIRRQEELNQIRSEVLHPVDIPVLLTNSGLRTPNNITLTSQLDWKLLISFPGTCPPLEHSSIDRHRVRVSPSMIKQKFKKGTIGEENRIPASLSRKVEVLSLYSCVTPSTLAVRRRCRVCTLASYGVLANNEVTELLYTRQFQGTNAIVVLLGPDELQSYSSRQEVRARVGRFVQSKPDIPAIPAVILLLESHMARNHVTDETIIDATGVRDLSSHLSEVTITRLSTSTDRQTLNNVIKGTVSWLTERSQNQLKLESDCLKNFVESGLQRYFFTALYDDVVTRKKARLADQCPEAVLALYNDAIEHLASVVSSTTLSRVSWPITEFCKIENKELPGVDWNSEASLSSLSSVILSLCLPPPPPGAENGTWKSESLLCHKYARQLPQSSVSLSQRVSFILEHKHRALQAIDFLSTPPRICSAEVPWIQVIEACISSAVTSLHSDPVLSKMEVLYLEEEMKEFVQPEIWREAVWSSKQESTVQLEKRVNVPVKTRDEVIHESVTTIDKDLHKILTDKKAHTLQKKSHTTSLEDSILELKTKLGTALEEARQDTASFEKDLQGWLPEYFPKKRKSERHHKDENPFTKSSRYSARRETSPLSS